MTPRDWVEFVLTIAAGGFLYLWLDTRRELRKLRDDLKAAQPKRDNLGRYVKKDKPVSAAGDPEGVLATWSHQIATNNDFPIW